MLDCLKDLFICDACSARDEARYPVPAVGPTHKRGIMIVGRNPGKEEDEQGVPFIGKSGQFLDKWIAELGIKRSDCYITNCVKCHTKRNREPDPIEIARCSTKWLHAEGRELEPKIIILLGADAYKGVFGHRITPWTENTGVIRKLGEAYIVLLPHPSAVISYRPSLKEKYDAVIEELKAIIDKEILKDENIVLNR